MKREVTFATAVWEKDWRQVLLSPDYLSQKQIGNHLFPFSEKILVINNVHDLQAVKQAAQKKIDEGVLSRFVVAGEHYLKRSDWATEWSYYNGIAPLTAIAECKGDYLLYLTGDVRLEKPLRWVDKAIATMEKHSEYKVANPVWNEKYDEARRESSKWGWNFLVADQGFSDQLFLVRREDFQKPIYGELRADSSHYPRGDVFEARVFSYMKNRSWKRIIFRRGSYTHENVI